MKYVKYSILAMSDTEKKYSELFDSVAEKMVQNNEFSTMLLVEIMERTMFSPYQVAVKLAKRKDVVETITKFARKKLKTDQVIGFLMSCFRYMKSDYSKIVNESFDSYKKAMERDLNFKFSSN